MATQNYLEVMESLYIQYEESCVRLEKRISELLKERQQFSAKSEGYIELYNRIRRLKRCLEDTKAWQEMVGKYLAAGGMSDEKIRMLIDRKR